MQYLNLPGVSTDERVQAVLLARKLWAFSTGPKSNPITAGRARQKMAQLQVRYAISDEEIQKFTEPEGSGNLEWAPTPPPEQY